MGIPYWRLSGFYGFYFASLGSLLPFWSLYLKTNGFNEPQIGELSALLVGTKILAPNISGWIADHIGKSLRIIRWTIFAAAFFFACFLLAHTYQDFAIITLLFSLFWNASLPQFEAATLFHIRNEPLKYGKIRLWGSIGFIAAVLGIGKLLDHQPIQLLPYLIASLLALTWLTALAIPETHSLKPNQYAGGILPLIFTTKVFAFLTVYLMLQIAHSPYYVFFSIYLEQHHYSGFLIGCLWALGVLAEIALFLVMPQILQKFRLKSILLISIFLSSLRWYLTACYVTVLGAIVMAQILHAATFASLHVVAMNLLQGYFGKHHQGRAQALYTSISFGLGGVVGGYYSGYLWRFIGAEQLFLLAAGCCITAFIIASLWVDTRPSKSL